MDHDMPSKIRILVICTGNSCRSQMAEGFFRHYGGDFISVFSAGTHPSYVHPHAVAVMREKGIDISGHSSESVDKYISRHFDFVITVCDSARERCPVFPHAATRIHWGFYDPVGASGDRETVMDAFRRVRDQIEETIVEFLKINGWLTSEARPG